MDWVEELRQGRHAQQIRLRPIRQVEELSLERLPQIESSGESSGSWLPLMQGGCSKGDRQSHATGFRLINFDSQFPFFQARENFAGVAGDALDA